MNREKVFKYIEEHFDEHLGRLQELVRQPSSPSATKIRLSGISSPTAVMDSQAFKKAASSPLVLMAPLATRHFPKGGISTTWPSSGGTIHPGSSTGCVSYIM